MSRSCPGYIQPMTDGREVLATSFDPCHQSKQAVGPGLVWVKKGQAQQEVEANTNYISHFLRFNFISLQTPKNVIFCFITQMLSCHLDVSFSLKSAGLPPLLLVFLLQFAWMLVILKKCSWGKAFLFPPWFIHLNIHPVLICYRIKHSAVWFQLSIGNSFDPGK